MSSNITLWSPYLCSMTDIFFIYLLTITSWQYALPYLRKTQGNIINLSSLVASIGQKDAATYVATKVSFSVCANESDHLEGNSNTSIFPQGGDHRHD